MHKNTLRTLPALLALAFAGSASAAAFQLWEQNASGLGTAYAGSAAVADNASANFFNPASLTQLSGINISAGVTGVGPSYQYRDNAGASNTGGDAGGWAAVPNAHISAQLSPAWTVGFSVSAPFGLATEYNSGWVGAGQSIKSEIKTVNFNPSVAYKLNDKISLGFGLNYQTLDGELTKTGARLKGDDASWGWNAGVLFTLSPSMRVGMSYRSAVKHTLEGDLNGTLPIKADVKLPDTFILSVWQQVSERWEAMGDLSYTRWETLQSLPVVRRDNGVTLPNPERFNYGNSWRIAWGAAYKATDAVKYKFGIAYDRTPVQDGDRSPRVPDNDRLWLSLGAQWNAGKAGKVDVGYSYLYVKDPSIQQGSLNGRYDAHAHIVGLQYSVGF